LGAHRCGRHNAATALPVQPDLPEFVTAGGQEMDIILTKPFPVASLNAACTLLFTNRLPASSTRWAVVVSRPGIRDKQLAAAAAVEPHLSSIHILN
jgi:hypothetical protein